MRAGPSPPSAASTATAAAAATASASAAASAAATASAAVGEQLQPHGFSMLLVFFPMLLHAYVSARTFASGGKPNDLQNPCWLQSCDAFILHATFAKVLRFGSKCKPPPFAGAIKQTVSGLLHPADTCLGPRNSKQYVSIREDTICNAERTEPGYCMSPGTPSAASAAAAASSAAVRSGSAR